MIDMDVHVDEVHEYTDSQTKEKRMSKVHGHLNVVPVDVKTGKLNGKKFAFKDKIKAWNDALERMTRNEFGCHFNSGKKRNGEYRPVEVLKAESEKAAVEMGLNERENLLNKKKRDIDILDQDVLAREIEVLTNEAENERNMRNNRVEAEKIRTGREKFEEEKKEFEKEKQELRDKAAAVLLVEERNAYLIELGKEREAELEEQDEKKHKEEGMAGIKRRESTVELEGQRADRRRVRREEGRQRIREAEETVSELAGPKPDDDEYVP